MNYGHTDQTISNILNAAKMKAKQFNKNQFKIKTNKWKTLKISYVPVTGEKNHTNAIAM